MAPSPLLLPLPTWNRVSLKNSLRIIFSKGFFARKIDQNFVELFMLFYFHSFDRNGNRKMRSRCFWYITGNKKKKKSNLQVVQGQMLQVISVLRVCKAQHVLLLLKGLTGIVDAVFKALVFYESIIFALYYYNIIRSLSCCQG